MFSCRKAQDFRRFDIIRTRDRNIVFILILLFFLEEKIEYSHNIVHTTTHATLNFISDTLMSEKLKRIQKLNK